MPAKYRKGDRVAVSKFNKQTPKYIRESIRIDNARTIVFTFYNREQQHTLYYLGSNGRGYDIRFYGFRAGELRLVTDTIGRPRERRKYKRRVLVYS